MAGQAVKNSCWGERPHQCNFDSPGCPQGSTRICSLGQKLQGIIQNLASHLPRCLERRLERRDELLLAIRGLGNIGIYGHDVERSLMMCGGLEADYSVRLASVAAIKHGSCNLQVTNWLKWQALNETVEGELRITAFQSLYACCPVEAEAVALLITEKESDPQVKSYGGGYISNGKKREDDIRQFSRHLTANLTSVFGLPETSLETDVIFQNSFLPRSVSFNLSSELLRYLGGSVQFGGRLENLEEVLQSVFGHDNSAGNSFLEWLGVLLHKAQEIFKSASEDFVKEHEREKRSFDVSDVKNLLRKVKKKVITSFKGWVFAGIRGADHYFSTFDFDAFAVEWGEILDEWMELFLESSYSFLLNSDVQTTNAWTSRDETISCWGIMGFPIELHKQEGFIYSAAGSSRVNLLSMIRNPFGSSLDLEVAASVGTYSSSHMEFTSLSGNVIAQYSNVRSTAFDASANLKIQGRDSAELKLDIPRGIFQGDSSSVVRSLKSQPFETGDDSLVDISKEGLSKLMSDKTSCSSVDGSDQKGAGVEDSGIHGRYKIGSKCRRLFQQIVGLDAYEVSYLVQGQHEVALERRRFIEKSEDGITGYRIGFSSKNPGTNSVFLDMYIEADGASVEQKMGVVFGLIYSPHFTIKVLLQTQQLIASGEVTVVNDSNLKRFEGHVNIGRSEYGIKAELLMVKDGGQVSVKPRLVISYPTNQEDALLEGYVAHYSSDKESSLSLDVYTEGTLRNLFDVAVKGTAEYRAPKGRGRQLTLKNVHLSTPHFSLGLESSFSIKEKSIETNVQATWNGHLVVFEGSFGDHGSGQDDQHYEVALQLLLPEMPDFDTKITCVTQVHTSEVTNNVTLLVGGGDTQREFKALHSASWRITNPVSSPLVNHENSTIAEESSLPGLASRIVNKLQVTSLAADVNWDIEHVLQLTNKSLENLIVAQFGNENHKIMSNFYDQSEEFFKYHMELEISLPAWHFSYVDTLQQRPNGDMVGYSTTVMPSGRIYSSSSRMYKNTTNKRAIYEMSYDVLIRDGMNVWKIVLQGSFDWSTEHLRLQSSSEVGNITVFGLELAVDGIISGDVVFHLKNWVKDLYEGEITLNNEGTKTDFNLNMIIVPFNREIKSKVAMGYDGCSFGLLDGVFSWDAKRDTSRTVMISSVLQQPKDGKPLELKGTMSVLSWTWQTELIVELGEEVGDKHRLTYSLILPDDSKFQLGSELVFSVGDRDLELSTTFEVQMPNRDIHNMSLVVQGMILEDHVSNGVVTFNVQSPITEEANFHIHVKTNQEEQLKKMDVLVKTSSEANYWAPLEVQASGEWNGTTANVKLDGTWAVEIVNINSVGSYWIVNDEHHISGSAEIEIPLGKSWKQIKSSLDGSFSVGHNPGKLKVTHSIKVEKDHTEIFKTVGEVLVHVPKVEGQLVISHVGDLAKHHTYNLEGSFTGNELEIGVEGLVDEVPLEISIHYIDGQEVTVKAVYRDENFFSTTVKTELKDGKGTSYTLTTNGVLVYRKHRSRLHHELFISPSRGSSILSFSPVQGHEFKLTTSRTKYNNHHWGTVISLDWGERTFRYQDDVYFPSFSECVIKIEVDAPDFNITKVTAEVEAVADAEGEQAVQFRYRMQNDTIHSARLMYYSRGTEEERIWRAGAQDVVLSAKEYSDLLISHAITLPVGGMEIKSNMTVGVIPIIGVGVTVTAHTRALLLSVCTTGEKCVRLRAHAHAQSTPSSRTYSVSAHALNSLFWKDEEDSLVQNSLTFNAQETSEKVIVAGGIRQVECGHVTCDEFIIKGILHATLQITDDDLEILLDTTNRTMKLKSLIRRSQANEISPAALPGGRLVSASTLETHIWLDLNREPSGMINWNSTVIRYASSRASEWVLRSGLYHESFGKVLRLGGQFTAEPSSAHFLVLLDIFSEAQDALKFNVDILQDQGSHVVVANLTKAIESQPRLLDLVVSFLPSPDSGEVSMVLIVPKYNQNDHIENPFLEGIHADTRFTLTCGLDSPHKYTSVNCRLTSPSVDEKVYVRYQLIQESGCKGLGTSLRLLNHNYMLNQKSCHNPNSFQASVSTKTEKVKEKELALRLGVLDTRNAELDLMDVVHVKFQLHPPFLLHAMAHSRGNMWDRWENFKKNVLTELTELFGTLRSVAVAFASDVKELKSLSRVLAPSPVHLLANYTQIQSQKILIELEGDELIKELSNNAQICLDVTSLVIEAGVTYLNRNYGEMIVDLAAKASLWTLESIRSLGKLLLGAISTAQDAFSSSASYICNLPRWIVEYASTVPLLADGIQWISLRVSKIRESYAYEVVMEAVYSVVRYINWGMSMVYPSSEDLFSGEHITKAWNIWVPLPECSHSLLDVWNLLTSTARTSKHRVSLPTAILHWWHLFTHPSALFDYFFPPFPAHGAVIGESHFVSLDGRTFSLNTSCSHILLTDARDKLFTLVSDLHGTPGIRSYTLLLGGKVIKIQPDYQVTIDGNSIALPYASDKIVVTRDLEHLSVATFDRLKRELISLICWTTHHSCVVTLSGWFHADTRGLLGHLNLDPADDLVRPSGQVALSGEVFSHSWQVGSFCTMEKTTMEIPSSIRALHLCKKFLLDISSPIFSCQDTVDIKPYYETCVRYLASFEEENVETSTGVQVRSVPHGDNSSEIASVHTDWSIHSSADNGSLEESSTAVESLVDNYLSISIEIKDLIFPFTYVKNDIVDATSEDLKAICNVMSAYITNCKEEKMDMSLPPICGLASKLTYNEPVSPDRKQVDVVMLVDESTCDSFMYENLIRPLPGVLKRIAEAKNITDIKMAAIGYGAGGGDVIYHIPGSSLLASPSLLKLSQPHNSERSRGSLRQSLRAVSNFPFRPGSVRIALAVRCSNQDIPNFTETLPKEMVRRRLVLFTLTPELLVFNPSRPKAVRNTVGIDRWRVYSLRQDKQKSIDSWGVRRPSSNIAQLATKSGGGVFTVTPIRDEPRAKYYMKLFKKVLSRAIMKTVNTVYNKSSKTQ
ncbi:apolipophorins-like isoform X2 [Palaemon carinicauda]|uniref:apolipophorins-like isoform X2 n=1 Tax=Palaemon carinicauda TaxID=392227 RepID=UPI0035B66478